MSMSKDDSDGRSNPSKHQKEEIIFKSPFSKMTIGLQVPDISLTQMLFSALDRIYDQVKDNIWVMDVIKETSYKFSDIKPLSTKFASALMRAGFKKGDVLFYVTYDSALIYILLIGTWLCGGVTRGCFQREHKEEYQRQMIESSAHFVLCDPETSTSVKWATEQLDWPVQLMSIGGEVEGTTAVEEMIENDDSGAFPYNLEINAREDVLAIPNTSGSTGFPKGAIHTHYNFVSLAASMSKIGNLENMVGKTVLTLMGNFGGGVLGSLCRSIPYGFSFYSISRFDPVKFIDYLLKYKPSTLYIYPYVAGWLARSPELDKHDFSFIESILCVGTVFDLATAKLLSSKLPQMKLSQAFAMSEILIAASSELTRSSGVVLDEEETVAGLKYKKLKEEFYVSSGLLLPLVEAKIWDSELGCTVGPNKKGNLWIRAPYIMKGYLQNTSTKGYTSEVDNEGWLDTGDLAFIDETGHLYILERSNFIFKYYTCQVSPAEIEAVICEYPAVLSAGVVAVPDLLTTSKARAFVVLKPGHQATEEEIKQFVAERKEKYKHLHGGVEFVDSLPENRGGKLDRVALLNRVIANKK